MEIQLLAIAYFELKEKALVQRSHIDYEMAAQLKALEKDETAAGKANVAQYKEEIAATEAIFQETIKAIQPVFEQLYPALKEIEASKTNPYFTEGPTFRLALYIDDHQNIHYSKE